MEINRTARIGSGPFDLFMGHRSFSKCSTPTPQAGQSQPSGRSSNDVPGGTPFSGSPSAGS